MQPISWKALLIAVIIASAASPLSVVRAAPIVVDFTDPPAGPALATTNFVSKGVLFSPNCHYHFDNLEAGAGYTNVPTSGGKWLGFDPSGCSERSNGDYLGSDIGLPGKMFVALASGQLFNLLSFDFVRLDGGPVKMDIYSSRGGYFGLRKTDGFGYANYSFSGDSWSDLDWIIFSQERTGTTGGFDNLTLDRIVGRVPEPNSLSSWLALVAGLIIIQRARRQS